MNISISRPVLATEKYVKVKVCPRAAGKNGGVMCADPQDPEKFPAGRIRRLRLWRERLMRKRRAEQRSPAWMVGSVTGTASPKRAALERGMNGEQREKNATQSRRGTITTRRWHKAQSKAIPGRPLFSELSEKEMEWLYFIRISSWFWCSF